MKTVVLHGKVIKPVSPLVQFPGAELWPCTHTQQQYQKHGASLDTWHAWWDLHWPDKRKGNTHAGIIASRPRTYAWYRTLPGPDQPWYRPLYMLDVDPNIPASVRFPIEEVEAAFPVDPDEGTQQWTCQVDYMIAYAILQGYERIVLHGHGVSEKPNHMIDHRGILYWIAVARTRGVRVTVLAPSWYRAPKRRYGYEAGGWSTGAGR